MQCTTVYCILRQIGDYLVQNYLKRNTEYYQQKRRGNCFCILSAECLGHNITRITYSRKTMCSREVEGRGTYVLHYRSQLIKQLMITIHKKNMFKYDITIFQLAKLLFHKSLPLYPSKVIKYHISCLFIRMIYIYIFYLIKNFKT